MVFSLFFSPFSVQILQWEMNKLSSNLLPTLPSLPKGTTWDRFQSQLVMLALLLRLLSLSPRSTTFTLFVFFYMFIAGPGAKILQHRGKVQSSLSKPLLTASTEVSGCEFCILGGWSNQLKLCHLDMLQTIPNKPLPVSKQFRKMTAKYFSVYLYVLESV